MSKVRVDNPSYDGKARFCLQCQAWFAGWRIKDGTCPGCGSMLYHESELEQDEETLEIVKKEKL